MSQDAHRVALALRHHSAESAKTFARAEEALKAARSLFAGRPWADNLEFIRRVEEDLPQADPHLQKIADVMRELLDEHRRAVQRLGTGRLQTWYEHYFPHIWRPRPNQNPVDEFRRMRVG